MIDEIPKPEVKEKIILLNEIGIQNKNLERRGIKMQIYDFQRQLDEIEDILEQNILKEQTEFKITKMNEMVKNGEDDDGHELGEADKKAVILKVKYLIRDMKENIQEEKLRLKLVEIKAQIVELKNNLKIVEKQIRERKIVSIHR